MKFLKKLNNSKLIMYSNLVKMSVNEEVNNFLNYKDVSILSSFVNE